MRRIHRRWFGPVTTGLSAVFLAAFWMTAAPTPAGASSPSVQRVYGTDAVGTAIAVSQTEFPSTGSAQAVVLARSDYFSDALAGGPLAASVGGPLLLTPGAGISSTLDPRVLAEIQRALPVGDPVYVLGGTLALSPTIDSSLQALGYVIHRVAGSDEYVTAVDIAQQLGNPSTIFEATGLSFQDALSAVPAAVASGGAILLTDGSSQSPATAAYLGTHPGDTRYAIGGPLAAYGADPSAAPVYGQTLYDTSAAVASKFFSKPATFGAATGTFYSDALSGGVLMGATKGPMLLVAPSGALPQGVSTYLDGVSSGLTSGYLFGGPLAVGSDVLSELDSIGSPTTTTTSTTTPSSTSTSTSTTTSTTSPPASNSSNPVAVTAGSSEASPNWSGYVLGNGSYTSATGTFTVPAMGNGATTSSGFGEWVGLDGYNNQQLIQAGIGEFLDPTNPNYYYIQVWWEILPAPPTTITTVAAQPGDLITVTIVQTGGSTWSITVKDDTNGQSYTTNQSYSGGGSSAEWIVEAPTDMSSGSPVIEPLAPFTPAVTFSQMAVAGTQLGLTRIVMDQNGQQVSTPSGLASAGFTDTYGSGTTMAAQGVQAQSLGQQPLKALPLPAGVKAPVTYDLTRGSTSAP